MNIIDATNLLLGRFATVAAKKALLGEEIVIVNCENAIISGKKEEIIERYKQKVKRGIPLKGPYFPKQSDLVVRRTIRGMLPFKTAKGREAFKRVMCYTHVPSEYQNKKLESIKTAHVSKLPSLYYMRLGDVCRLLGGKK